MTLAKIMEHKPTPMSSPIDQHITEPGHSGRNTMQYDEQYRMKEIKKIESNNASDTSITAR